ncbi:MAG: sigma-70 family RNA polymerase sigma factor [Phycisphaerae bacterium]|nr:sigma-70 family RNA polymerase sigma factor [Phycisphaerae bacterium]
MSESETVLLQRLARTGDAEAFSEIVTRYAGMVYSAALRVLADADRAADATQETFFDLLQHASDITGSVGGWLHRVATRKAIDRIRRDCARRSREAQYAAGSRRPGTETRKWQDISPWVDEALDEVDDETRHILIEHFFHAKTLSDIAAAGNLSQPTVSRRVEAGLERLRDKLRARGILVAAAALSGLLTENAVQAAPAAVLTELGKMAMVGGASSAAAAGVASAGSVKAVAASALTGTSAKLIAAAAVVIAGTGGIIGYNHMSHKNGAEPPVAVVRDAPSQQAQPTVRNTGGTADVDTTAMTDEEFEKWLFGQGTEEEPAMEPQPPLAEPSGPAAMGGGMQAVAPNVAPAVGPGFGGMGMGAVFIPDFTAPDRTVTSFVHAISSGDMARISQCFVEGADDIEDIRRIMEDPQDIEDVQMRMLLKSIGPPVEIVRTANEQNGLGVSWLSTIHTEFTLGDMVFKPGDKFELDATLVEIDGQWKMVGM